MGSVKRKSRVDELVMEEMALERKAKADWRRITGNRPKLYAVMAMDWGRQIGFSWKSPDELMLAQRLQVPYTDDDIMAMHKQLMGISGLD